MSVELTPLIAESELHRKDKRQLAGLRIKTFKGLARRKRGTLLKQIPDLSPRMLFEYECALAKRSLDFVPDATISPRKCSELRIGYIYDFWMMGITSWEHVSRLHPRGIIKGCHIPAKHFFDIEKLAIAFGYKPPHNDFRDVKISKPVQEWLFVKCGIFSIQELKGKNRNFGYRLMIRPTQRIYRLEILYRLWQHGVELPHSKDKTKTP